MYRVITRPPLEMGAPHVTVTCCGVDRAVTPTGGEEMESGRVPRQVPPGVVAHAICARFRLASST